MKYKNNYLSRILSFLRSAETRKTEGKKEKEKKRKKKAEGYRKKEKERQGKIGRKRGREEERGKEAGDSSKQT